MNDSYLPISNIEGSDFEGVESWHRLLELTQATWRVADLAMENEMLKNKVKSKSKLLKHKFFYRLRGNGENLSG